MATTSYATGNALAVKLWAKRLFVEALKECFVSKFIGTDSNSLIHLKTETQKSAGDKITVGLRMQLSGAGVSGDSTLEGNEEALTTYSDSIYIDQLRHAVRSGGRMSDQRVHFSVREEALQGLKDWWTDRYDTSFFNHVCGISRQSDTRYTGGNTVTAATSGEIIWSSVDHTSDETLDSTDPFDLTVIDRAVAVAKTASPMIRPVRTPSGSYYVVFIHPYQTYSLRSNTNTGQWNDIQKAVLTGGDIKNNPLFSGALGVYNGCILHESARVPQGANSSTGVAVANTRRAVLCGAQAALMAFGQGNSKSEFSWDEEGFDYGNQLGVSAGAIWGLKKTVFNSNDFATIVMSSYSAG